MEVPDSHIYEPSTMRPGRAIPSTDEALVRGATIMRPGATTSGLLKPSWVVP
jgi:hypothetical protein